MKKLITTTLSLLFSLNVFAEPLCLVTKECMEYNGQIIDLRSPAKIALDNLRKEDAYSIPDSHIPQLTKYQFSNIIQHDDSKRYFIPLELRESDMMVLAAGLSLGVVVFANDQEIMDYVQESKTEETMPIAQIGNVLGREGIAPIAAGAYFLGAVLKNGKLKKVGLFTVGAGLATQLVTEAFKKTFHRVRPNSAETPYEFFEPGNNSFFSGHTSAAFSLATVFAEVYKDQPVVPYIAYGAAALTAYARMHDKKHWASDVLVGAIAGHLITKIFIRTLERNERTGSGLMILPEFGIDHMGKPFGGVRVQYTPGKKKSELNCSKYGLEGRALIEACISEAFARSERNF